MSDASISGRVSDGKPAACMPESLSRASRELLIAVPATLLLAGFWFHASSSAGVTQGVSDDFERVY